MKNDFFKPDLIVEVTNVCDRKCKGCYANNSLKFSDFANSNSFIDPIILKDTFRAIISKNGRLSQIAVRGGEPMLHPNINEVLQILCEYGDQVFLETHGKWLFKEESQQSMKIYEWLRNANAVLKISFDRMHGSTQKEAGMLQVAIKRHNIRGLIAVTAADLEEFNTTKKFFDCLDDSSFIFQPLAVREFDLIKPKIGVINYQGKLSSILNHKLAEGY